MVIIDTTVIIALLKGKQDTVKEINELIERKDTITITAITVYELLKGAYLSSRRQENLLEIKKAISNIQITDLSPEACTEAARIYCELKDSGRLIGEVDILIAAIAKTNGEALFTYDQHFKAIQGLQLI